MFGQSPFRNNLTRRYVALFGTLFNNIQISRPDSEGNNVQTIRVPIAYGPKEKWMRRRVEDPDFDREIGIQFPRIGYELTGLSMDSSKRIVPIQKIVALADDNDSLYDRFVFTPYILTFSLFLISTSTDDVVQMVEQIIPFFVPDFTVTVSPDSEMSTINDDIPIVMNPGIDIQDEYIGDFEERRTLIYTLTFDMHVRYYGPRVQTGIIKKTQIDLLVAPGSGPVTDEEVAKSPRSERITIQPGLTANGEPTNFANNSIDYRLIKATDDWGFVEELEFFVDEKKYNPITGKDESIK